MAKVDVMAVASFGGHFEQLLELRPAWKGKNCIYITTSDTPVGELADAPVTVVQDCHQGQVLNAMRSFAQLVRLVRRHRPQAIVTTGALPGLLACVAGKTFGARTIWIDSLANASKLSMSGRLARKFADHHFSQWPNVAENAGSEYAGTLL